MNADALVDQSSIIGANLFVYCLNNLVNYCDSTGLKCVCLTKRVNTLRHKCESSFDHTVDLTEKLTAFMEDNANKLKEYKEKNGTISAYLYFIKNVNDEGELDIKLQDEWKFEEGTEYVFNGKILRYDDPGNINFGYVGAILFPEEFLCFGAGLNQITKYGFIFGDISTWYDDPRDNGMIKYGYSLYFSEVNQ